MPEERWLTLVPEAIRRKHELYNYNNAVEILSQAFPEAYEEIVHALDVFSFATDDILQSGGNESTIPKKFSAILHPEGWAETKISGDLVVKL
jgi:hypothetical protein